MLEIRNATQEDLNYVKNNPFDPRVAKDFGDAKLAGWSKTIIVDGKIVAVGGVIVFWPGVGHGWYNLSKDAEKSKITVVNCIDALIRLAIKELNLHRLEATVRVDFDKAKNLLEFLGFECETPKGMKKYTAEGIDAFLYSLTF